MPQYVDLVKKYLPEEQRVAYQEEVDNNLVELPETIDQIWEETGGLTFEVWISEEDGYLERFKYQSELTEQVEGSFELEVSFSGLNQQQNIKAPDSALPLDEFFSSIIPQDIIAPEAN